MNARLITIMQILQESNERNATEAECLTSVLDALPDATEAEYVVASFDLSRAMEATTSDAT